MPPAGFEPTISADEQSQTARPLGKSTDNYVTRILLDQAAVT